jgi:hypothetical protein
MCGYPKLKDKINAQETYTRVSLFFRNKYKLVSLSVYLNSRIIVIRTDPTPSACTSAEFHLVPIRLTVWTPCVQFHSGCLWTGSPVIYLAFVRTFQKELAKFKLSYFYLFVASTWIMSSVVRNSHSCLLHGNAVHKNCA